MKKLKLLVVPFMAASFLVGCGGSPTPSNSYTFHFDGTNCKVNDKYEIKPQYKKGANVSITIVPDDNYVLPNQNDITVKGVDDYTYNIVDKNATFTCVMPGNNVEVIVTATDPRKAHDYLSFTCNSTGGGTLSYVGKTKSAPLHNVNLEYSLDRDNWTKVASLVKPDEPVEIHKFSKDETIYLRGNNPSGMAQTYRIYTSFVTSEGSDFVVSGDIMSIIDKENFTFNDTPPVDYCFTYLFKECNISDASALILPGLPSKYCYMYLFDSCSKLTNIPAINATTLEENCCYGMFRYSGLVTVPTDYLSSYTTNLQYGCYASMFYGCTSLTQAPALPATVLADGCYNAMFYGCTSLTEAPGLPAKTLAQNCYNSMFCESGLTKAPVLPATTLADSCYHFMFDGCTSLAEAPTLPATTLADSCYDAMFRGCTSLNVSEGSGATLIFKCPTQIPKDAVKSMFSNTGGSFKDTPTAGNSYYWN
ncbi:MAG: leucine-rich repeat protein [Bacilli bacterium]|nr:leucine-rich repeat protein [Bacilli bacterium]